jgi:hypothetical protein
MEDDRRPVTVIRADLVRAKDQLAALGGHLEGTVHSFARHRVMSLSEELALRRTQPRASQRRLH